MTRMMGLQRTDGNLMFLYALFLAALSVGNVLDNSYMYLLGYTLPASALNAMRREVLTHLTAIRGRRGENRGSPPFRDGLLQSMVERSGVGRAGLSSRPHQLSLPGTSTGI